MNLTKNMNGLDALKAILSTEKARLLVVSISAILCTFLDFIFWIDLFLIVTAIAKHQYIQSHIVVMALILVTRYCLMTLSIYQAHITAYQIIQKLRQFIIKRIALMSIERLQTYHRGDLEKRINHDCQSIEPLIAHHSTNIIIGLMTPILLSSILFWIDWRLGMIAISPLPLAILVQFIMMRGFNTRQVKYNKTVTSMHKAQLEFLRSIGVMKLFSVDTNSYLQLNNAMDKHHKLISTYTKQVVGTWVTFITLAQSSLMLVIPFAIQRNLTGQLTHTELAMVVMLCAGILKPWLDLTQIFAQIQKSLTSIARLTPLLTVAEPSPEVEIERLNTPLATLSCREIGIERGKRKLLSGINLTLFPGDRILIQGASGSGKSSLLATLSGALKAVNGGWFVNNENIDDVTDHQRSKLIAVVDQAPKFFSGSLKENLSLDRPDITDNMIWELLGLVELSKLVDAMPQKLNTSIGETQRTLSGGEIQRLAIVRATLTNTPILILDEATAHLDNLTEQKVLLALHEYAPQQIQMIISHRSQAVKIATHRYRIENGCLSLLPKNETHHG